MIFKRANFLHFSLHFNTRKSTIFFVLKLHYFLKLLLLFNDLEVLGCLKVVKYSVSVRSKNSAKKRSMNTKGFLSFHLKLTKTTSMYIS